MEPPGTAPGSEPLITRTFIAVVHKNIICIVSNCENWKRFLGKKFLVSHIEFAIWSIGLCVCRAYFERKFFEHASLS